MTASLARTRTVSTLKYALGRIAIVIGVLAAWEFLPQIDWLRERFSIFDPFFVSSPSLIVERLGVFFTAEGPQSVWPNLLQTLAATGVSVAIGTTLGAVVGLVFSNDKRLARLMSPFITMFNAIPRVALIPIFIILVGPTPTASVLASVLVVFFLVFYNAYSGGLGVAPQSIQNARLLGASPFETMRSIRLPYVLVWTFASLPNAISFGIIAVVTAEIMMGTTGMGRLLSFSIQTVDSTLSFAVIVVLTIVGVSTVTVAEALRRRILHWWDGNVHE